MKIRTCLLQLPSVHASVPFMFDRSCYSAWVWSSLRICVKDIPMHSVRLALFPAKGCGHIMSAVAQGHILIHIRGFYGSSCSVYLPKIGQVSSMARHSMHKPTIRRVFNGRSGKLSSSRHCSGSRQIVSIFRGQLLSHPFSSNTHPLRFSAPVPEAALSPIQPSRDLYAGKYD